MNNKALLWIVLIVLSSLFICAAKENEFNSDMFEKIFQYELNNLAFAYISVTSLAEKMAETEQADFWHAYTRMEQLSQPRYQKASEKYGLKVNSFLVKLKVWGTDLALMLFPKKCSLL